MGYYNVSVLLQGEKSRLAILGSFTPGINKILNRTRHQIEVVSISKILTPPWKFMPILNL